VDDFDDTDVLVAVAVVVGDTESVLTIELLRVASAIVALPLGVAVDDFDSKFERDGELE
jgi:hypothetical protein